MQISGRQVEDNGKGLGILKKRKVVKEVVGYADAWPLWNVKKPQPSVGTSTLHVSMNLFAEIWVNNRFVIELKESLTFSEKFGLLSRRVLNAPFPYRGTFRLGKKDALIF